jgi:hypothetical protein
VSVCVFACFVTVLFTGVSVLYACLCIFLLCLCGYIRERERERELLFCALDMKFLGRLRDKTREAQSLNDKQNQKRVKV